MEAALLRFPVEPLSQGEQAIQTFQSRAAVVGLTILGLSGWDERGRLVVAMGLQPQRAHNNSIRQRQKG